MNLIASVNNRETAIGQCKLKMEKYVVSRPVLQGAFRLSDENNSQSRASLRVDTSEIWPLQEDISARTCR